MCNVPESIISEGLADGTRLMVEGMVKTATTIEATDIIVLPHLEDDLLPVNSNQAISLYSSYVDRNTFMQGQFTQRLPFECTHERSDKNARLIQDKASNLRYLGVANYIHSEISFDLLSQLSALVQLDLEIRSKIAFPNQNRLTMNLRSLKILTIIWDNQPEGLIITVDAPELRGLSIRMEQSDRRAFTQLKLLHPQTLNDLTIYGKWELPEIEVFTNLQTFEYMIGGAPLAFQRQLIGEHSSLRKLSTLLVSYLDANSSDQASQFSEGIPEEYVQHLKALLQWKRSTLRLFFESIRLKESADLVMLTGGLGTSDQVLDTQLRRYGSLYPDGIERFEFDFLAAMRALQEEQAAGDSQPVRAFPADFHSKFAIHTVKVNAGKGAELLDYQLLRQFLKDCPLLKALEFIDCITGDDFQHFLNSLPIEVPDLTRLAIKNRDSTDQLRIVDRFAFLPNLKHLACFETNHLLPANIIRNLDGIQFFELFSFKAIVKVTNLKRKRGKAPESTLASVDIWVYADEKQPRTPKQYSLMVKRVKNGQKVTSADDPSLERCLRKLENYLD